MTSSWCNQMCMNGKISQGPLNDINVWCNRSFKTKLYPIKVRQYSHLKWTEVLIEVLKYPNLELYSWCSYKDHSCTRGRGLMPLKKSPPPLQMTFVSRAVASLTLPGGQAFQFPHFFLKFWSIFLSFPQIFLIFFLILVLRVGNSPTRKGPGYASVCETLASTYVWSSTINNLKELSKSNMLLDHFKCTLLQEHVCYALGAVCFSNMVLEHI